MSNKYDSMEFMKCFQTVRASIRSAKFPNVFVTRDSWKFSNVSIPFVYSERILGETTPQRALSTGDSRSLGFSSSVRVHRFRETVSFAVGTRHELRLAQY